MCAQVPEAALSTNTAQPQLSLPFQAHTSHQHIQFFWTNQYWDKIATKCLQKSGTNPSSVLTHSDILSLPTHCCCQRLQELFTKADPEIFSQQGKMDVKNQIDSVNKLASINAFLLTAFPVFNVNHQQVPQFRGQNIP